MKNTLGLSILLCGAPLTAPLWITMGALYCLITGQSLRTMGRRANEASGME